MMNETRKMILTGVFLCLSISLFALNNKKGSPCDEPCPCPPSFQQGMPLCCDSYPRAYNAPARIDVKGCWDIDLYGSFIYWHVSQEGMAIGVKSTVPTTVAGKPLTIAYQPFEYKPGFKVGLGTAIGSDGWTACAEYTRLHQTTTFSDTLSSSYFWSQDSWISTDTGSDYMPIHLTTKWKMNLDMVDLDFSRPFYQGMKLTVSPYGGLRGLWINQRFFIAQNQNLPSVTNATYRSHCWSVGPNGGVTTNWLVGAGFRFEGTASASLLYTRYTTVALRQFVSSPAFEDGIGPVETIFTAIHDYDALRPIMELGLGVGWGTYLNCNKWYLDFSLRYDFLQFWSQNMIRYLSIQINHVSTPIDNLQMHGLTASARFDF